MNTIYELAEKIHGLLERAGSGYDMTAPAWLCGAGEESITGDAPLLKEPFSAEVQDGFS